MYLSLVFLLMALINRPGILPILATNKSTLRIYPQHKRESQAPVQERPNHVMIVTAAPTRFLHACPTRWISAGTQITRIYWGHHTTNSGPEKEHDIHRSVYKIVPPIDFEPRRPSSLSLIPLPPLKRHRSGHWRHASRLENIVDNSPKA